ncbi:hypothetical protein AA313_de0206516 [Arthrobotrys entomopaga]|nr:hypothetical protein AA313_de0206516 [Arthrobotrys entomopaga]
MYQDDRDMLQQDVNIDTTERILDRYSSLDYMTSWIFDSSSTYTNPNVENPWSSNEHGNVSTGYNIEGQYIQQNIPTSYQTTAQSPFRDLEIYNEDGQVEPMDFDEVEPQSPYVILLDSRYFESKDGNTITTPWIYLWKAEKTDIGQVDPPISSEEVRLERARYVKNPEMQAAKAFYNALQILRRILQANEAELSPHLRTHHERTNCEAEMIQSFKEYELHAQGCSNCCSALMSLERQIPLCEFGMTLAEKVFLAIDWYATATFGDYETVTLEVSDHSVRSLLLAFANIEPLPPFRPEDISVDSLAANAPVQTLAAQSLGIISSIIGVEDKTSTASRSRTPKRKRFSPGLITRISTATTTSTGHTFLDKPPNQDHLAANPESIVSCLDDYLNVPARRRFLRSQISQEGMMSIRRLFNASLHGYNLLEQAFNESIEEDYDFYQDFPNHTDLLSLGVQTFIELSNEKPSYPTALREVYSVLHLCDSINQILPQEKHERQRRVERFIQELKDWRNIIEAHDERSAFELIVQVRWPSPYLRFSRRPSENPTARRIKGQPERPSKRKSEALSISQTSLKVNTPANSSNLKTHAHTEDFNPMSIALLWMQLIAGIVFTTIAAYFSFNHRMVNIFVQYLSGGDPEILDSSQTIQNASTRLPNNSAWISSNSIQFIEKTKRFVISKLKVSEFEKFSQAVEVAMDSLSCGWISTIKDLETILLRVAKLIECTKLEFQVFVQRVLDLCGACAANMTSCETHRMSRKRSFSRYNNSYETSNPEKAIGSWVADEDEIPLRLPKSVSRTNSNSKSGVNNSIPDSFDGPLSPALASLASSRSLHHRIKSDFLDDALMSTEDRLISDTDAYFPIENSDRDLSGGPIAAYTSIINGPTLDPVLTLENQDNLLSLSQATYPTPISKSYSQAPSSAYNTSSNFESFWSLNRHEHPLVVSSLPEHAGYYLTPSSNWNIGEDFLGSTSAASSSSTYYPPPTSIPTSLSAVYNESLKATVATSLPATNQAVHRLSNPFLSSIAASPISPYPHPDETPRFLPTAPTPPPPVPPPKPRKRRRSSPLKEEDNNGTGTAPPPKRQKKTMLFKCPICKHDIAAPRMNLTRHIKSVHADSRQRRIECEWPGCATTFQAARKDNYRAHLRKHQEKLGEPGN